jgi:hypothetical protein
MLYLTYTVGLYYGTDLIDQGEETIENVLVCVLCVMFCYNSSGAFLGLNVKYAVQNDAANA